MFERTCAVAAIAVTASVLATSARADIVPAPGFIYAAVDLGTFPEGCLQQGPGGLFVTVGPQFSGGTGGTRRVVFLAESGATRTVATGLNAVADCVYDRGSDVLYIVDNGLEFSGATVGDTVLAIPDASTATGLDVGDHELVPSGSIATGAGIAIDAAGDLLVADAAGGGNGRVVRLELEGGALADFATGFDFTGGLAVDSDGTVLVAESDGGSFANRILRYTADGSLLETVSGDTYDHGSVDLAFGFDGRPIATGSNTIARIDGPATSTPLVTGIEGGFGAAFGGGLDVDRATGRVVFGASNFDGGIADRSVHMLIPVDGLLPGRGRSESECLAEFYGLRLQASRPGGRARRAICVDGDPCDSDGIADGGCLFPVGFCTAVEDARHSDCSPDAVDGFELLRARPESAAVQAAASALVDGLPGTVPACVFSDGYRLPLRQLASGAARSAKARLKVRAVGRVGGKPLRDADAVVLECLPAS
jgi:hypothetical protein